MKPEPYLNDRGQEIFARLVEHTKSQGLADADSYGLSVVAQLLYRIEYCSEWINENGTTQVAEKTGWEAAHPYVGELNKNQALVKNYFIKYGLTPEDRAKLTAKSKQAGKLDKYKKQ